MKTKFILFLSILSATVFAQDFKVMTYNIRYDNQWDTINSWDKRKASVFKLIEERETDLFGVQEALHHQIKDMEKAFKGFEYVGVGRDDGKTKGEYAAIFFNTEKFQLLESGTFWLSETPEKPSVGWDASMERICTYAHFVIQMTKESFWVFNAHYDHIGMEARKNSSLLILDKINQLTQKEEAVILMGDLNALSNESSIKVINDHHFKDTFITSTDIKNTGKGSFNGFQKEFEIKRIDYVFTKNITAKTHQVLIDTMPNGNFPSDHFPVLVEWEIE